MDPDELLARLRELTVQVLRNPSFEGGVVELAEGLQNLDEWLEKGGFLPVRWEKNRGRSIQRLFERTGRSTD